MEREYTCIQKKKQTQRNKKEEFVDFAQVRRKQVLAQARARADGAAGARGTRQQQRLRLKRRWLLCGLRPRWKRLGSCGSDRESKVERFNERNAGTRNARRHDLAASAEKAAVPTLELMCRWAAGVWGTRGPATWSTHRRKHNSQNPWISQESATL